MDSTGTAPQTLVSIKPSAFDAIHPPEKSVMDTCVHCGFCLPACPTYTLWQDEMDSPRGRIWMMRKAAQGEAPLDETFQQHMDHCLGCMSCMTACPSGVEYNKLIEDTRGQVERNIPRTFADRLFRKMLFATFSHPKRLRSLGVPLAIYQRTGLQSLMRKSGLLKLLPARLAAMDALLPTVPLNPIHSLPTKNAATTAAMRTRVAMLTGCVQDAYFDHVNRATIRVLTAFGYEVVIPESQGCCGALLVHSGLEEEAHAYAKRLIEKFESTGAEFIVINAAGCGSTMKEYGHLLRDDATWAARAAKFSASCRDISELLSPLNDKPEFHALPIRIAYHDACHLRHAQGIFTPPRALLQSIPSLDLREIADGNLCCGSAGVYNLLYPETAAELGDRKAANVLATEAEALVSANPGCLLQLAASLRRNGHAELPTFHTVEILDAALRGISREELLAGRRA
ncbi:(Fe-S)-binding protein [Granulicella cerasi]|uniref:Glycolate oxidase iron-sulfur subunit n=1 Tax=Granulicella cerasi TaxID=741063 RepID=A0ABW1Z7E9_9BACT|nr:heterodisulfide reductase-related iron-sulfur binding cluster [Granulicella cerasi]